MLKVENLVKIYDNKKVVDNLSFTVANGSILGLLGVNGAGKTTTFRMILGIIEANEGTVYYNDKKININNSKNIGYLTEERSLLLKYTLADQIRFYASLKLMNKNDIEEKMDYWLKFFNLTEYKNKKIKELSKGNQQKVQLITAIIHNPDLLILDEPFSGLDPINLNLFKEVITEMKNNGCAIIFSSHRMDHVDYFCEDVIIMLNGVPIVNDTISNLKDNAGFKKLFIKGEFSKEDFIDIKGVIKVTEHAGEFEIIIQNNQVAKDIFNTISADNFVEKFVIDAPSMEEIFIQKVGEENAKI